MSKENILFVIIGLLGGMIIGFVFANSVNQKAVVAVPGAMTQNAAMPGGHPEVPGAPSGSQAEIQSAIDTARKEPDNFDAQLKAAELYYQIQRFDAAIEFLKRANQLKPESREVVVHLGNAYFDSGKYEDAEKSYTAALTKKADDVDVRTDLGLTYMFRDKPDYDRALAEFQKSIALDSNHVPTLQNMTVAYTKKGDAAKANESLTKLEVLDPTNEAIKKLREEIEKPAAK